MEYEGDLPVRLKGEYVRDEEEQARYFRELLEIFTTEGVDSAFACTFVCYGLVHRADPREDLDLASWGVVKVLEEGSARRTAMCPGNRRRLSAPWPSATPDPGHRRDPGAPAGRVRLIRGGGPGTGVTLAA